MSHKLELIPGTAAYAFAHRNEPAWHGLGQVADDSMTNAEVAALAGVEGSVKVVPLRELITDPDIMVATGDAAVVHEYPDGRKVVRSARVSDTFNPWSPEKFLADVDALTGGGAVLDTVGMLGRDGATVFATFTTTDDVMVGPDQLKPYINVKFGWNGQTSRHIGLSFVRQVCANTVAAAWAATSQKLVIRNTQGADLRVLEAREILDISFKVTKDWAAEYEKLVNVDVTDEKFSQIVSGLFDLEVEDVSQHAKTRRENDAALFTQIYNTGQAENEAFSVGLPGQKFLKPLHDTVGEARGTLAGVLAAWNELQTWYATPRKSKGDIDWSAWYAKVGGQNVQTNAAIQAGNEKILTLAGVSI